MMVPRILCAACLVTALSAPAVGLSARQDPAPPAAQTIPTDAFDLASATVQALSLARSARARLTTVASQGLLDVMANTRLAISRLDSARKQVRLSRESVDESIRAAAMSLEASLDALVDPLVGRVGTMEKLLEPDTGTTEWQTLTAQVTSFNARLDEAWTLLPASTLAVAQALVDATRTLDGNLAYMKLTRKQHQTMVADLERMFPGVSAQAGGDHPVAVSVRVLQSFVTSGWRAADERAPVGR